MANNDAVLAELEAQLRAPDSILEPGVLDLLKDYLRAGGKPQAAIEDLSENYCGVYCSVQLRPLAAPIHETQDCVAGCDIEMIQTLLATGCQQ
jgi:hypothetical protein